jgi:hypothetical protein
MTVAIDYQSSTLREKKKRRRKSFISVHYTPTAKKQNQHLSGNCMEKPPARVIAGEKLG